MVVFHQRLYSGLTETGQTKPAFHTRFLLEKWLTKLQLLDLVPLFNLQSFPPENHPAAEKQLSYKGYHNERSVDVQQIKMQCNKERFITDIDDLLENGEIQGNPWESEQSGILNFGSLYSFSSPFGKPIQFLWLGSRDLQGIKQRAAQSTKHFNQ